MMTAIDRRMIFDEFKRDVILIEAHADLNYRYVRWGIVKAPVVVRYANGLLKTYKPALKKMWEDEIPKDSAYAMPEWLEEAINRRKRTILLEALGKIRYGEEEED